MQGSLAIALRRFGVLICLCLLPNIELPTAIAQTDVPIKLIAGQKAERELKGGQAQAYDLEIEVGYFVEVMVEQLGVNISVTLMTPDGKPIFTSDSHRGLHGIERISVIADSAGRYQIKIHSIRQQALPGSYRLIVAAYRPATAQDRLCVTAQERFAEADRYRQKPDDGSRKKARESYQQALAIWTIVGDQPRQAIALRQISALSGQLKLGQDAVEEGEQALALYRALGDRSGEAHSLFTIAEALSWVLKDQTQALGYYERSLRICREIEEPLIGGLVLQKLAILTHSRGDKEKALEYAQESLMQLLKTAERGDVMDTFGQLRAICESLEDTSIAREAYDRVRQLYRGYGDPNSEAQMLVALAWGFFNLPGEKQRALDHFHQALVIYSLLNDSTGQLSVLNPLSRVYASLGQPEKAIELSQRALQISREINHSDEEIRALIVLGESYCEAGDWRRSLDIFQQAARLSRVFGKSQEEAKTLTMAGLMYYLLQEYTQAMEFLDPAVALSRSLAAQSEEAFALNILAEVYRSKGEKNKAKEARLRALTLYRNLGDVISEAETLHNIGWLYFHFEDYQSAIEYHAQAAQVYRQVNNRVGEANSLRGLGRAYGALGQTEKGIDLCRQAIALVRKSGEPAWEALAFYALAQVSFSGGRLAEARESLEAALRLQESVRANVANWELRAFHQASSHYYYVFYIDVLMRMHEQNKAAGYDAAALQASERSRARSLLELLAEAHADLQKNIPVELVRHERNLQQQINDKTKQLLSLKTKEQDIELNNQLKALLFELRQVEDQIRAANPRLAALTKPKPLDLAEIRQQLDPDTLLLEYALGTDRSYLWVVTQKGINVFELPKRDVINEQAGRVHKYLSDQQSQKPGESQEAWRKRVELARQQFPAAIAELSQTIIAPVAKLLGNKRLVIVADGALQYVPFAALLANSKPLVVDHEIVNLPSASTIAVLRREFGARSSAPNRIAILADPVFAKNDERLKPATKLPSSNSPEDDPVYETGGFYVHGNLQRLSHTKSEAEAIAKAATGKPLKLVTGFNASRQLVVSGALGNYDILHFATHSQANSEHPELSYMALSLFDREARPQNGFLRLHDIYNLRLSADLIVLSACQTALGQEINGEGLIGLTRGFMHAGAPRVIASLWNVEDRATAELMKRFYAEMLGPKRLRPAAALRAAQISMCQDRRWNQPYHWAAFVLQGEWR